MTNEQLKSMRDWATTKITKGDEPPWSWYQYMKLREAIDALMAGMATTTPLGSPESGVRQERHLRLVGDIGSQESVQHHPHIVLIQLPS